MEFPEYDADDELHRHLVDLAAHAEQVAAGVSLDSAKRFETARRAVREALAEDGVAVAISDTVRDLLATRSAAVAG